MEPAVIAVVPGPSTDARRWRLVSRTGSGADVLAQAAARDGSGWRAIRRLRDGDGVLDVVATDDGHFRWTLTSQEGGVIAQSPPVYRDPAACRTAFDDARRAARVVLGGSDRKSGARTENGAHLDRTVA